MVTFADTYLKLRAMAFELDPSAAGLRPTAALPNVWGIIVDWGTDTGVATFVALADGTGSMYTSSGGGTIGGGGQPTVVEAGRRLLSVAEAVQGDLPAAASLDPPTLQAVRYWIMTHGGARTATHGPEGPPAGEPALRALGGAFQGYVTAFRPLGEGQGPVR